MRLSPICAFLLFLSLSRLTPAAQLDAESAKRILEAKWLQLKPDRVADRRVLFQDVRSAGDNNGSPSFTVNALVWDLGKGNPKYRDWGETCVSKFANQRYTFELRAGNWEIFGPLVELGNCKANPAEGVSGVPITSLPGAPAGQGPTAKAAPLVRTSGVGQGAYECWSFGSPRPLLDLTIRAGNQYVDSEGKMGSFSITVTNGHMTFRGGVWDGGVPGGSAIVYYEPKGIPVISIRDGNDREFAYCEAK